MTRRDALYLLLLSAIWGSSFTFIKLGVGEMTPAVVVLGRLAVGFAVLLPLAAARGGLGPLRAFLVPLVALGLFNNALPFWLLGFAEERIDSGLAAVIQAVAPIITVLLAWRLDPSQRVQGLRLIGIAIGFAGVVLLVGDQRGGELVGALAVLGTATCYAVSVLYAGRTLRGLSPLHASTGQLAAAALMIAPFALFQLPDSTPSTKAIAAVVALGALGTGVAYLLYFTIIRNAGASRAILVTYLVPAFALLFGIALLDEPVVAAALGGLALILFGTALATGLLDRRR